jgi:Zn-finger nucleic acid-binding protein
MHVETVDGVNLDVCPNCAGIWFDAEELHTLLARDPLALSELEDKTVPQVGQKLAGPSPWLCPNNQIPLQQYQYLYDSPVVLHACPQCGGFFVEEDELGKMQQWLDQSRKPMTPDEKASIAVGEAAIAHDKEMRRQQKLLHFFNVLQQNQPGWIGLIP